MGGKQNGLTVKLPSVRPRRERRIVSVTHNNSTTPVRCPGGNIIGHIDDKAVFTMYQESAYEDLDAIGIAKWAFDNYVLPGAQTIRYGAYSIDVAVFQLHIIETGVEVYCSLEYWRVEHQKTMHLDLCGEG